MAQPQRTGGRHADTRHLYQKREENHREINLPQKTESKTTQKKQEK